MMQGALENITQAVGNTPIVRLNIASRRTRRRDLRQVRVPEPGRQPQGPPRVQPPPSRRGSGAQARRHHRRGDERQHGRVARALRRGARLQVHLRHARQDEPGEDLEPARVRREGRRLPHGRRCRGSAQLLQGLAPHRRRDAELLLREPVPQPREPRGALPLERARRFGSRPAATSTPSSPAWARAAPSAAAASIFKEKKPEIKLVGVDPVGSLYYDFVKTGRITKPFSYKVEGIGEDFFPTTMNLKILDDIVRVDDKECFLMTRDLTRLEGLFVGGSGGAAVAGRDQVRARLHGQARHADPRLPLRRRATSTSRRSSTTTGCARTASSTSSPASARCATSSRARDRKKIVTASPTSKVREVDRRR